MGLREWATRVIKEVAEDGTAARAIRLTGDTTWETWNAPFPDVEQFLVDAAGILDSIKAECPVRRVPLMFTAENATGAVLTQYPTSVQGTNKNADALAGSGNNAAKAFAEGMEGLTRVMTAILACAEKQQQSSAKTMEQQANTIHEQNEYIRAMHDVQLTEQKQASGASEMVMAQIREVLPMIPTALELFFTDKKISNAAELAKSVVSVVSKTTNGVTTS